MKLVIERAKWWRGKAGAQLIRPEDGMMCCLGFYGLACGVSRSSLLTGFPSETKSTKWPDTALFIEEVEDEEDGHRSNAYYDTKWTERAVDINDDKYCADSVRERKLAEHFAYVGVEVEFV